MEKISKPIIKQVGAIRLYLGDLIEVIDLIKKDGGFTDIKLTTEEHEYTSDEISNIGKNEIISKISGHTPFYLLIEFNSSLGKGIRIYASEDTVQAEGLVAKIEKLFLKNRRNIYCLLTNGRIVFALYLLCQVAYVYLSITATLGTKDFVILFAPWIILYILYLVLGNGKMFKKNIIYLKKEKEIDNFFIRNKDRLLVNILSAVIGGLIGFFLGKI